MSIVHVECPACHEELEVDLEIGTETQGVSPYTASFEALDGYTINWQGHTDCQAKLAVHTAEEYTRCGLDDLDDIIYKRFEEYIKEGPSEYVYEP